jgi:integrase/recombinase XerD
MLRQWWKAARPQGWLFPGRPAVNPLTTRQLNRLFHLAAKAAETNYDSWLLGHQRLDTTAHYTRVATSLISKVVSPLDQLVKKGKKDEPPK